VRRILELAKKPSGYQQQVASVPEMGIEVLVPATSPAFFGSALTS